MCERLQPYVLQDLGPPGVLTPEELRLIPGSAGAVRRLRLSGTHCGRHEPGSLQPYVPEAATVCAGGCNRMCAVQASL